jgi:hypothetical protein
MFSTGSSGTALQARVWAGGPFLDFTIPGSWLGAPHLYRVDWGVSAIDFSIDGVLVHTQATAIGGSMRPAFSDFSFSGVGLLVDWARVSPYPVACGADLEFAITADSCFQIADVIVDGASVGAVASYTFTNVMANHTIEATFAPVTYTITASAGPGGTISPDGAVSVACGTDQTFTIAPDSCSEIVDVLVDGVSVGAVASYTFTAVGANHTIDASFAPLAYTITASAGLGGTISPDGAVSVSCGTDQTFTITPDACHQIADVLVDGVSVGAVTSYTFTAVTANHTISATFLLNSSTITATAGPGGTITPSGAISVNCGADQSFLITPDLCHTIGDVLVDGVSVGPVSAFTFTNVTANHTIDVVFDAIPFTITASAGAGGSISPVGGVVVGCGSNQTFTITPDPCYHVTDVLVDGISVGAVTSYTFTNVTANHTISASFSITTYTLTLNVIGNGTVTVIPNQTVFLCGSSAVITATPGLGYVFQMWTGDATGNDNPLSIVMDDNKVITAVFVDVATAVAENLLGADRPLGIYPNPSTVGETQVMYRAPESGSLDIAVYDVTGKLVRQLASGVSAPGIRSVGWNGRDESGMEVSAGTYFVRMSSQMGGTTTKRVVLIR